MPTATIDYSPLQANRKFYLDNKEKLVKKYNGQHILLHDLKVVKTGENWAELAYYGLSTYGVGNFCVQFCTKEDHVADLSHIIRLIHGA